MIAIKNAGKIGNNSLDLLNRIDDELNTFTPNGVILLCATNDMLYIGHQIKIDDFEQNMLSLIRQIKNSGAWCIVCSAPPVIESYYLSQYPQGRNNPKSALHLIQDANVVIKELAQRENILFFDLAALICARPHGDQADSMLLNSHNCAYADGLHFTAGAADLWAKHMAEFIRNQGLDAKRILCLGDSLIYGAYLNGRGQSEVNSETFPGRLNFYLNFHSPTIHQ